MASKSSTFPLTIVFTNLFKGFPKLLLTNVIFAVPFAVFFGIFYAINTLSGLNSNFILLLTIIPLFPFYSGVVQVSAHISQGRLDVSVFQNFVAAVKDNFLRFFIHGIVAYLAVFFSYWSISLYARLGGQNWIFFVLLAISIIIAVFFLFMFFYIPSMTVTFDISMKNIYKNSFLMSFGELKHNIIAVFGLVLLFAICTTVVICCSASAVAIMIATIFLVLFIIPSVAAFIINSAVYKRMYVMIVDNSAQSRNVDKKMSEKRSELADRKNKNKPVTPDIEELKKLEIDESADMEEYIYFNGRMMKRKTVLKLKQEALENDKEKK